jgi:hypothetical protein
MKIVIAKMGGWSNYLKFSLLDKKTTRKLGFYLFSSVKKSPENYVKSSNIM